MKGGKQSLEMVMCVGYFVEVELGCLYIGN